MERIEKLRVFLAQSPQDAFLLHALALEFVKLNDKEQAKVYFKENLASNPDYVATYYHLGKLYEALGDTISAVEIYEKGIAVAARAQDSHALGELRAALDNILY